ncbi:MAG TPA: phospholipase D-like domain-containing protein [Ignavibacteriaceae bacterium]|nr:phospholipase D-like domain-containing protein [Ignavibacteriaceae bacterium]
MKLNNKILINDFTLFFTLLFLVSCLSFSENTFALTADHLVISEILIDGVYESSASNNDEFVEIYNPTSNPVDVSNWTIDYRSASSTTFNNKYTFPAGTIIQSHKFYLFGGGGVSNRDNSAQSVLLGLGNTGGGVFLRNSTGTTIDLIGWGTAIAGNYEGTVATKPAQGVSLERKANSSSTSTTMGIGGSDELEGNGYDTDDNANDFVQRTTPQPQNSSSPAEPAIDNGGNGTGTASVTPEWVNVSDSTNITFKLAGGGSHTLDSVLIIIPSSSGWIWSGSKSDITVSGTAAASSSLSTLSDTIYIGSAAITSTDSLVVKINNVKSPSNAVFTNFVIKTGLSGGEPLPLAALPRITVIKTVPIIQVHVNDASGVPTSPYGIGSSVTISGIITADYNSTGTDVYVQDATAGIDLYSPSRITDYQVGDSVTVTGTILQFRGLTEISPDPNLFVVHSHGNKLPDPMVLTAEEVNLTFHTDDYTEPNEGRLVRLNGVTYNASSSTITDASGTTNAYFGNMNVPAGIFDLVGILKQYKPGTTVSAPYTSDYEVNPRSQADIISGPGPSFLNIPVEKDIQPNSVSLSFKTSRLAQTVVRYGKTSVYSDSIIISNTDTVHLVTLSGLWPATVYHYQVVVTDTGGTNYTGDAIFSSASPAGSSGEMDVYFNHAVDTSVSLGEDAQVVNISQKFINQINEANYSIDLALYSLSGTVGANIANALIAAKNRGVKVRVIGEHDNQGTDPWSTLKSNGIPLIDDAFDAANKGNGLMHNKFGVFDFRDTSSFLDDWVWSGSWNATDPGNDNDAQNVIEIQDKSLAQAYTIEFNEMWGSNTDTPNSANSRFGIDKTDNTPHRFNINGTPVQLYFDPSDHTTSHMGEILNAAQSSINIAMLTFTRDDLAQILINKKTQGDKVRVILDNNTDTGNEFANLQNNGIDIHLKGSAVTGLLHHKYAVIDADISSADQVVITGSHNWSSSAETSNNENTLIIHSKRIANLYLQEFKARYIEAGGTDIITDITKNNINKIPLSFDLKQNYPNPFNPSTTITFSIPNESFVIIKIYNTLGQEVKTLLNRDESAGSYSINFNASYLSSGIYFYSLRAGNYYKVKKMMLLK